MPISDRDVDLIKELIKSILASLRQVCTISAGVLTLYVAFATKIIPVKACAKLIEIGGICFLATLAISLLTHVLFALSYVYVIDPGKSFVKDNLGAFILFCLTLILFGAGFICLFAAVAFTPNV
jgi:hypothetical protein